MSARWETARHCYMALSLLATNIKQTERDPRTGTSSQVYAFSSPERHSSVTSASELRGQKRRKLSNPSAEQSTAQQRRNPRRPETSYPPFAINFETGNPGTREPAPTPPSLSGPIPLANIDTGERDISAEGPSSLVLNFPDSESNNFTDGPNFDLNMVDLLQGANFDSLFEMIGQQYPSF